MVLQHEWEKNKISKEWTDRFHEKKTNFRFGILHALICSNIIEYYNIFTTMLIFCSFITAVTNDNISKFFTFKRSEQTNSALSWMSEIVLTIIVQQRTVKRAECLRHLRHHQQPPIRFVCIQNCGLPMSQLLWFSVTGKRDLLACRRAHNNTF